MKHTNGKWEVTPAFSTSGNGEWTVWERESGIYICETWTIGDHPCAEEEANARLIAAAPELLEAAKKMREYLELVGCGSYQGDMAMLDIIRAAIAKAEGEEPE